MERKTTLSIAETSSVASSITQDFQEESHSGNETDSDRPGTRLHSWENLESCSYPVIENLPGPICEVSNHIDEDEFAEFIRLPIVGKEEEENELIQENF